jgi:dolichol-phosphate mannosyltransferase
MTGTVVVIPTYNEADNIRSLIEALFAQPLPDLHVLVVDDNSPDGTADEVEASAGDRVGRVSLLRRSGKLGLGTAYIAGITWALQQGALLIGQMDADFSHDPAYLPGFVQALEGADVVYGSRYVAGGSLDPRWGFGRKLLSSFGNRYARAILGLQVLDATGGYRLWRRHTLEAMPLDRIRSNGYVFQVEMAYVAQRLGFRHVERPIYFEDRRIGRSKMSLRIQMEAAVRVWQVRHLHRNLRPLMPLR